MAICALSLKVLVLAWSFLPALGYFFLYLLPFVTIVIGVVVCGVLLWVCCFSRWNQRERMWTVTKFIFCLCCHRGSRHFVGTVDCTLPKEPEGTRSLAWLVPKKPNANLKLDVDSDVAVPQEPVDGLPGEFELLDQTQDSLSPQTPRESSTKPNPSYLSSFLREDQLVSDTSAVSLFRELVRRIFSAPFVFFRDLLASVFGWATRPFDTPKPATGSTTASIILAGKEVRTFITHFFKRTLPEFFTLCKDTVVVIWDDYLEVGKRFSLISKWFSGSFTWLTANAENRRSALSMLLALFHPKQPAPEVAIASLGIQTGAPPDDMAMYANFTRIVYLMTIAGAHGKTSAIAGATYGSMLASMIKDKKLFLRYSPISCVSRATLPRRSVKLSVKIWTTPEITKKTQLFVVFRDDHEEKLDRDIHAYLDNLRQEYPNVLITPQQEALAMTPDNLELASLAFNVTWYSWMNLDLAFRLILPDAYAVKHSLDDQDPVLTQLGDVTGLVPQSLVPIPVIAEAVPMAAYLAAYSTMLPNIQTVYNNFLRKQGMVPSLASQLTCKALFPQALTRVTRLDQVPSQPVLACEAALVAGLLDIGAPPPPIRPTDAQRLAQFAPVLDALGN